MERDAIGDCQGVHFTRDEILRFHRDFLTEMASRYIWWMTPADAVEYPAKVIAQVMNVGVLEDAMSLIRELGEECLRAILRHTEAGQFNERSWHFWHYRLDLAQPGKVPALPARQFE